MVWHVLKDASVTQQVLSCSNAHLHLVLLKHSDLKGDTFWENKLLSNDLGKN